MTLVGRTVLRNRNELVSISIPIVPYGGLRAEMGSVTARECFGQRYQCDS